MTAKADGLARLSQVAGEARRLLGERDRVMVAVRGDGASWREIGEAVGMTHTGARRIVQRLQESGACGYCGRPSTFDEPCCGDCEGALCAKDFAEAHRVAR